METKADSGHNGKLPKPTRIGIVGCENVSKESIYSLGLSRAVDEIVLVGEGQDHLLAGIEKLTGAFPLGHPFRIVAGTYNDLDKADIVVAAVCVRYSTLKEFPDRLAANARSVRVVMEHLRAVGFSGIVLVMANPADEIAQVAQETSGFPVERVIGIGGISPWLEPTVRDARKKAQTAVTWCSAHHSGGQLMDSCQPDCPYFEDILEEFSDSEMSFQEMGAIDSDSLASCTMRVCEAIVRDERTVLTVSAKAMGEYGIWGVYMTLPCVISRKGVERIVEFNIPENERRRLLYYARELAAANRELAFISTPICPQRGTAAMQGTQS
jgi:L-lactate dehydrogenase